MSDKKNQKEQPAGVDRPHGDPGQTLETAPEDTGDDVDDTAKIRDFKGKGDGAQRGL